MHWVLMLKDFINLKQKSSQTNQQKNTLKNPKLTKKGPKVIQEKKKSNI